jgi:hypothetical protein
MTATLIKQYNWYRDSFVITSLTYMLNGFEMLVNMHYRMPYACLEASRRRRVGVDATAGCEHVFRNLYGSQKQYYVTGCAFLKVPTSVTQSHSIYLSPSSWYFKSPDDGGNKFLQNVGNKLPTRRHTPENYSHNQQRCENLELQIGSCLNLKNQVFWGVTLWRWTSSFRRFDVSQCLQSHPRRLQASATPL